VKSSERCFVIRAWRRSRRSEASISNRTFFVKGSFSDASKFASHSNHGAQSCRCTSQGMRQQHNSEPVEPFENRRADMWRRDPNQQRPKFGRSDPTCSHSAGTEYSRSKTMKNHRVFMSTRRLKRTFVLTDVRISAVLAPPVAAPSVPATHEERAAWSGGSLRGSSCSSSPFLRHRLPRAVSTIFNWSDLQFAFLPLELHLQVKLKLIYERQDGAVSFPYRRSSLGNEKDPIEKQHQDCKYYNGSASEQTTFEKRYSE
jgi:hypothetical protein